MSEKKERADPAFLKVKLESDSSVEGDGKKRESGEGDDNIDEEEDDEDESDDELHLQSSVASPTDDDVDGDCEIEGDIQLASSSVPTFRCFTGRDLMLQLHVLDEQKAECTEEQRGLIQMEAFFQVCI